MTRLARLCLFGAAPDTGNLGVSALCFATLGGLVNRGSNTAMTVFDYGRGIRHATARLGSRDVTYARCGGYRTRRFYRSESFCSIRLSCRFGGFGNPAARAILASNAILDISGGDSFTDLYGPARFWAVAMPKLIALEVRRPLILLPQTYGPFRDARLRKIAERIARQAAIAWARDPHSYTILQELLGKELDSARHRCGVDVAFALEPVRPDAQLPQEFERWIEDRSQPIIGMNVSGLLYNDAQQLTKKYGLQADYRQVIVGFLRRILRQTDSSIILVPHVVTSPGHYESDYDACRAVAALLDDTAAGRLVVLPPLSHPGQAKWVIAHCDWFCGARMHSTIAALSSGVPTAAIAYSDKTRGVFQTCGLVDQVVDSRKCCTEDVVAQLWALWTLRKSAAARLAEHLPRVLAQVQFQMEEILQAVRTPAAAASR